MNDPRIRCPVCDEPLGAQSVLHLGYKLEVCPACGVWCWKERSAPDYDQVYTTSEYADVQINPFKSSSDPLEFARHPTYAPFFREVRPRANGRLLDVGCGVGRFLVAARAVGWNVRGVDISTTAVEIGRKHADLDLSNESLDDLAARGAKFDAVTAFEVLEHLEEPVAFVRSALRILAPEGWFFCTVPNRESQAVLSTSRPDWLPPVHLQFYSQKALARLLERSGGSEVRTGFVLNEGVPRTLVAKAKRTLKRIVGPRPDPLGIWGMVQAPSAN